VNHWGERRFYKERVALLVFLSTLLSFPFSAFAQLGPSDVLILVNANSFTSRYIAKMYRQYYPSIQNNRVLELSGLADCSGPSSTAANEIITRDQYNSLIAGPLRNYLLANNLVTTVKVIITTAGLPYRIEDTRHPNVIYPAGSNDTNVFTYWAEINAASVESELTCLWYSDYGPNPFGIDNRMVNPYQGYVKSPSHFFERFSPGTKAFNWTSAINMLEVAPLMEGFNEWGWPITTFGTINRQFGPGDIYLTCRLDGPKNQGQSAVFAVRKMLERAKRASNPAKGINPAQAVVVLDDAPSKTIDYNRVYNVDGGSNYLIYTESAPQPPDVRAVLNKDDFTDCYVTLTGTAMVDLQKNVGLCSFVKDKYLCVLLDRRSNHRTCQTDLDVLLNNPDLGRVGSQKLLALACYGRNGDEGPAINYLTAGLNGGSLFGLANGAVFTSIESFNAVTMFSNAVTTQAKIIDFISIGGAGAIGHAFEPVSDATVDNLYFFYNLFADHDGPDGQPDGYADLTFVEAAFTGIPYLSWSEVVIGDPLMRIAYGPGGEAWTPFRGDANRDDKVDIIDVTTVRYCDGGGLYSNDPAMRAKYIDLCDFNCDGNISNPDVLTVRYCDGTSR
jgi:hypothetical protein